MLQVLVQTDESRRCFLKFPRGMIPKNDFYEVSVFTKRLDSWNKVSVSRDQYKNILGRDAALLEPSLRSRALALPAR